MGPAYLVIHKNFRNFMPDPNSISQISALNSLTTK